MKKRLLSIMAALALTLTASAQQAAGLRIKKGEPIDPAMLSGAYTIDATQLRARAAKQGPRRIDTGVTPDNRPAGDYRIYRMSFIDYQPPTSSGTTSEDEYLEGAGSNVVFGQDGQVWFYNLAPTIYHEWFQGHMEGDTITFSDGKLADVELTSGEKAELFLTPGRINGSKIAIRGDFQFVVRGDSICSADPDVWVCTWLVIDNNGRLLNMDSDYKMALEPNTELTTPPADARIETYSCVYNTTSVSWYGVLGHVAFSGNDVYMDRLAPDCPGSWIKGTLGDDGRITVEGDHFLGTQDGYIVDYAGGHSFDGGYNISVVDRVHLKLSADSSRIDMEEGDYALEFNRATKQPLRMVEGLRMERYNGDELLTPSAPHTLLHSEDYGDCFAFCIDNVSEDYRYLNPECISWRIFVDGKLYTFTPAIYPALQKAVTQLDYGFTLGSDFAFGNDMQGFYLYEDEWQTVDVQAIYIVDGEQCESTSLARYDRTNGYSTVTVGMQTPQAQAAGIAAPDCYDLSGRRVSGPARGITLQRQADGRMLKVLTR